MYHSEREKHLQNSFVAIEIHKNFSWTDRNEIVFRSKFEHENKNKCLFFPGNVYYFYALNFASHEEHKRKLNKRPRNIIHWRENGSWRWSEWVLVCAQTELFVTIFDETHRQTQERKYNSTMAAKQSKLFDNQRDMDEDDYKMMTFRRTQSDAKVTKYVRTDAIAE